MYQFSNMKWVECNFVPICLAGKPSGAGRIASSQETSAALPLHFTCMNSYEEKEEETR